MLRNGGTLGSYDGCDGGTSIYIGASEVADCSGAGFTPSFEEINNSGRLNGSGIIVIKENNK